MRIPMDLSKYRLLTVDQFCDLANITRSQFDVERRAGRLKPIILGIRALRITFEDYLDWVMLHKAGTARTPASKGGAQ